MKEYLRLAFLVALLGSVGVSAQAKNTRTTIKPTPPAETPPPDYLSTQYTDSRGCQYIKSDIAADNLWIPRVGMNGSHLCGGNQDLFYSIAGVPAPQAYVPVPQAYVPAPQAYIPAPSSSATITQFVYSVGAFSTPGRALEAIKTLEANGYQAATSLKGNGQTDLYVYPKASQSQTETQSELASLGFPNATMIATAARP